MSLETYISEFSKYVIAIVMILYVVNCYTAFLHKSEEKCKGVYARQTILMFAFHFSSFMVICFETQEVSYLIFYAFQQIVLYVAIMLFKSFYPKTNRLIINNMCMLLSISFVILTRLDYSKAIKQFAISSGSLAVGLIVPFLVKNLKILKRLKWIYAGAGVAALGIMMVLGQTTYGSKISYSIAGISFSPAEFVKIIFAFFIASALYESTTFIDVLTSGVFAALHVIIQVANKDLGSALIFFVVYICVLFVATRNPIYLALGIGAGSGAAYLAYRFFAHVQVRVQAWQDPWSVIDSAGYQITQSLFGITSGGYFGLGLYKGAPNSIPFVEDDFIFSALSEEFGIIFAVCLILICLNCFISFAKISLALNDKFYQLTSFGLAVTYIFQVFLTIGGGSKFIPLTGVTLPLVSYGGTSVLTTILMFTIIEGMYMLRDTQESRRYEAPQRYEEPRRYEAPRRYKQSRRYEEPRRYEGPQRYEGSERYKESMRNDRMEYYEDEIFDNSMDESDDDMEFLHGFTVPIDNNLVNQLANEEDEYSFDDFDFSKEILYNEEEYEKDQRNKN